MSLRVSDQNCEPRHISPLRDSFQRPMQDLRISVIDRCNFRCTYCMPEENYGEHYSFLSKNDWLTFGEIVRLTKLFVQLGVSKVRLTGGEPLLRPNLNQLIQHLGQLAGIHDLALTTNGAFLSGQAKELFESGLCRLTVSLDTLDEEIFQRMNGARGTVQHVLDGITKATSAGFRNIKINAVIQKNVNDGKLIDLVTYARQAGHILRFIEYMDVGNCNHWKSTAVVPSKTILDLISSRYPLIPIKPNYYGEVAERYHFQDGQGEIGFISSVSQPFCGTCTRLRLSTDGKLYTCLFATSGTDLRTPLRDGATDTELIDIIAKVWHKRNDKYSENRYLFQALTSKPTKIEMYQIGG
ncbi:MAG: GTP 3',8-cyclase MoaA [Candidatus Omnitrophica bacterium]|nr:GTP 3',8-cyclase MoaA [Candidatus Omnitrophota bacterium]